MSTLVWVITIEDPDTPDLGALNVAGVAFSEDTILAFAQDANGDFAPTVAQMGGFSDPDAPFEVEADGTWHASTLNGGEIAITRHVTIQPPGRSA